MMPFLATMLLLSISQIMDNDKSTPDYQLKKKENHKKVLIVNQNLENQIMIDSKNQKRKGVTKVSRRSLLGKKISFPFDNSAPAAIESTDENNKNTSSKSDDDNQKFIHNTPIAMRPHHKISPIQKLEAGIQRTQPVILVKKKTK